MRHDDQIKEALFERGIQTYAELLQLRIRINELEKELDTILKDIERNGWFAEWSKMI